MFDPTKFTIQKAKPLPIMFLLDVSGSMTGIKIDTLNDAVKTMLDTFANEEKMETEIIVSIITFGEELKRLFPFTSASKIHFLNLVARGGTPLGKALEMAKAIIEDHDETPSRAYRPTVVLVSDGRPGDSWQPPLEKFILNGRSAKCDRMAMAIGSDADLKVLGKFVEGTQNVLFEAHQASEIYNFFKKVTMSVVTRTQSKDPNVLPPVDFGQSVRRDTSNSIKPNGPQTVDVSLDGGSIAPRSSSEITSNDDDDDDSYF